MRGVPTIGKAADKIEKFTEQIENFRSRLSALSIPELIEAILEETGYKKDLEAEGEIEEKHVCRTWKSWLIRQPAI